MHRLLLWFTSPQSSWCQLEIASCINYSPQALACSTLPTTLSQYTGKPIVAATLKIWAQIRQHFKWSTLPRSTHICNNHLYLPAIIDPRFVTLAKRGLQYLENLYVDGSFASFNQLHATFGLNQSDFFRYFQLRDIVRSHSPTFPQILPASGLDHILPADALSKGHVFYLYELILPTSETMVEKIKANWESELQINLSDHFWGKALKAVNSFSSCARLSLFSLKCCTGLTIAKPNLPKFTQTQ